VLGYLAQSSYWVYLVHYPITIFIGAAYYEWTAIAGLKILSNVLVTTVVCVVTYQVFVRRSFIGVFLNGKKYS
jgi:peptidoglycan/LPS O-acetylase OafA/YrhL